MPFTSFTSLSSAAEAAGLDIEIDDMLPELEQTEPAPLLLQLLQYSKSRKKSSSGEMYMREFFIAPILHNALQPFEYLNIWANDYALQYEEPFSGYPDYLITGMKNPRGAEGIEQRPFLALAEAKKENFTEGWGQCLAELYACQRLNERPETPVWGIVTTGELWQFGRLEGGVFTRHSASIDLDPLGKLLAVLHYIFKQCDDAARKAAGAPPNSV